MTLMGVRGGGRDRRVFCVRAHRARSETSPPACRCTVCACVCLNQIHRVHRYSSAPIARGTFEAPPWPVNHPSASRAVTCIFTSVLTCSTCALDEHAAA